MKELDLDMTCLDCSYGQALCDAPKDATPALCVDCINPETIPDNWVPVGVAKVENEHE